MARVLLADESVTVQRAVSSMLADEGFEVVAASDGRQAIELLDQSAIALVITGLSLPAISGEELCRYIKSSRRLRHVPVIMLVGAFEPLDAAEARRAGVDAQLPKPPQSRPLVQTVRNLLEKSNSISSPSLPPPFSQDRGFQPEEEADNQGERARPQSVFFKPYKPPPNLTTEQLSLDVRALPARVQPSKLERKPERAPEGAAVIFMTVIAVLVVVALALWLVQRSGNPVSDGMQVAGQTPATEAPPAGTGGPEPSINETADARAAQSSDERAVYNGAAAGPDESSDDKSQAEEVGIEPPQPDATSMRGRNSRGEQNNRAAAAPSLVREQMLARARAYEDRGMIAQAELQYRATLHNFPGDATSRFALKRIEARIAAERREQGARARRDEGLRAFRSGNYSEAATSLTAALNAGRGDTTVLYSLGMAQWKLGRAREAKASFERCLVSNPNYAPAMVGLAQVKAAEGKRAEAVALLNRALQLGGGAEFSPERIREMISRYTPRPASRP
ncbi:MAG TPA: response regulator [Blastocatellia bacterium]|nr:response regulator [Blastocatellia bacterium]